VAKVHFKYYEARASNVKLTNYKFSPLVRQIPPFIFKLETLIGIISVTGGDIFNARRYLLADYVCASTPFPRGR